MCRTRGGCSSTASRSAATKPVLAPTRVDEPPVLAPDVDDQGLAGGKLRIDLERRRVDLVSPEGLGGEPAEDVVADAGADRRRDAQPGEVDRRVGGAAADVQDQLVDRDQLAGSGQVVERRANMVGHDQPGANDGDAVEVSRGRR